MKSGVLLLQDAPWSELRERARQVDGMAFDTIWVADHLVEPYHPESTWLEAWTLLGALASSTTRPSLGALASSMALRNPTLLAQATQTLRDISGGRAELALGAGGAPLDHQMTGTVTWSPAERSGRFDEFVPLVARILREGEASRGLPQFPVEGVRLPAAGGVRLTIAALGVKSITLAAKYGDAWNSYGIPTGKRLTSMLTHEETLELFKGRKARYDREVVSAGRDPRALGVSYTWVESYVQPLLADLNAAIARVRDFQRAGVTEFITYWPQDGRSLKNLGAFAKVVAEL